MVYLSNIYTSLLTFILTSFLVTIPIVIFQYRQHGYYDIKEAVINYLFIFYLQTICLLVMLPLPDNAQLIANPKPLSDFVNLVPFSFIYDILTYFKDVPFAITTLLKAPPFYQAVFNVVMFMPLGIFLKNRFKWSFKKVILVGFLISLLFEITQLTAVFGLYARPFRVFDVDDLITNTLGALLGYKVAWLFVWLFPNRKKQAILTIKKNKQVSMIVQYLVFLIDVTLFSYCMTIYKTIINVIFSMLKYTPDVAVQTGVYLIGLPLVFSLLFLVIPKKYAYQQTVAMRLLNYEVVSDLASLKVLITRMFIIYLPFLLFTQISYLTKILTDQKMVITLCEFIIFIIHAYFVITILLRKKKSIVDQKLNTKFKRVDVQTNDLK